jgi:hypothetical protein
VRQTIDVGDCAASLNLVSAGLKDCSDESLHISGGIENPNERGSLWMAQIFSFRASLIID